MSNPAFGTKYTCEGCSERFYDLNRSVAICPKCALQQPPPKPRMARQARPERGAFSRRPVPVVAEEKLEPAEDLVVDDVEEAEIPDDEDIDDDVEIELEIEADDEKETH